MLLLSPRNICVSLATNLSCATKFPKRLNWKTSREHAGQILFCDRIYFCVQDSLDYPNPMKLMFFSYPIIFSSAPIPFVSHGESLNSKNSMIFRLTFIIAFDVILKSCVFSLIDFSLRFVSCVSLPLILSTESFEARVCSLSSTSPRALCNEAP